MANKNDTKKKNREPGADFIKTVSSSIKSDTDAAMRALSALEKKADKIREMSEQGSTKQGGFLSAKQVDLYRDLLAEMEDIYTAHYKRLSQVESTQADKLDALANDIKKREEKLFQAKGGNRWGEPAHESVINFHEKKLKSDISASELIGKDKKIDELIDSLHKAVNKLSGTNESVQPDTEKIEEMYVRDEGADSIANGITSALASSGVLMSTYQLSKYVQEGGQKLSENEYSSAEIGQKSLDFDGDDRSLRKLASQTGIKNQYDTATTLTTQGILTSGGGYSDRYSLAKDTESAQQYGRATATNPDELSESFSAIRKLGTMDEGEMSRFAGLIANAIGEGNMRGREEELLRTSANLMTSMSSKLVTLDENSATSIVKMQTDIGEAIPELRGERGGDMLDRMDSAIKGGGSAVDLLLGKGTEHRGTFGAYNLRELKEEGLTNPENLQGILNRADTHIQGSSEVKAMALQDALGLTVKEYKALDESGILDNIKQGEFNITDKQRERLESDGHTQMLEDIDSGWGKTKAERREGVDASKEDLQQDVSGPFQDIKDRIGETIQKFPKPLRVLGGAGSMYLGTKGISKMVRNPLSKLLSTQVKDFSGVAPGFVDKASKIYSNAGEMGASAVGKASDLLGKTTAGSVVRDTLTKAGGYTSKITGMADKGWTSMFTGMASKGASLAEKGGIVGKIGTGISKTGSTVAKIGGKVPILSALLGTASDRLSNPEHSWGRSVFKGAGNALGTMGGLAASTALALGTGGAGLAATAGLTVGGGMAGEKLGDSLYSLFAGSEDKDKQKALDAHNKEQKALEKEQKAIEKKQKKLMKDTSSAPDMSNEAYSMGSNKEQRVAHLTVGSFNVENRSLAEVLKGQRAGGSRVGRPGDEEDQIEGLLKETPKQHTLHIDVTGNIVGMSPKNEEKVTGSLTNLFSSLFGNSTLGGGFDPSTDQVRR